MELKKPKNVTLADYQKKLDAVRKTYNIEEKIVPRDTQIDRIMCQKLKLEWKDYMDLTMQSWMGVDEEIVMTGQY